MTAGDGDLGGVRALVFDVFGTVVDWRSGVIREIEGAAASVGASVDAPSMADEWRAGYPVAMERVRVGELPVQPVDALHRMILDGLLARYGLEGLSEEARAELNRAWHRLDPWPDVLEGLGRLKRRYIIATLSNGNVALLVNMARRAGLPWDAVLSAELFGHFKPDPEVYLGAARLLGLEAGEVMLVAAHPADLRGAAACGLRTAYVPRALEWGAGGGVRGKREGEVFDLEVGGFGESAGVLGV